MQRKETNRKIYPKKERKIERTMERRQREKD